MSATRSPFLTTYVALAVAAALGAYIFLVERERDPDAGERVFASFDSEAVRGVEIAPSQGETIRLNRSGGQGWRLEQPLDVEADAGSVASLIASVEELELEDALEQTAGRLADFGLEPARITLRLLGEADAELVRLELGSKAPGESAVYAREPGRVDVFTVSTSIESDLDKRPFDFRDRDLLHVERDRVARLEVSGPEGDFTLQKTGADEWSFVSPLETLAGRWSVDSLVGLIANLRMESVAAEQADELAAFGLDPPQRRVIVGLEDGETKTLEIGGSAAEGTFHARDAGRQLVAVIPGALVDDLAAGMDELRAKRLLDVSTFEVDGLSAELGSGRRVYARESNDDDGLSQHSWSRSEPEQADVETAKVEDLLYKLTGLEVQQFVDTPESPARYGLEEPAAVIRLRRGEEPELEIALGLQDERAWGKRPNDAAVLELDPEKVAELLEGLEQL